MKTQIKRMGQIGEEIARLSQGTNPILVLDTGGLIDISQSSRSYGLNGHKKTETNPTYMSPISFLRDVYRTTPIIVTPKTYQEIQSHSDTMRNGYVPELGPGVVDYSLERMLESVKLVDSLRDKQNFSLDDVRYDAYWASKEGCNGNAKKCLEGCSDTDREILEIAALLSRSKSGRDEMDLNPVLVLSSDAHVLKGAEFLKNEFQEVYSRIIPISTRTN